MPLAPYLSIPRVTATYTVPEPPGPNTGNFDLFVNTSFNPASPTLKDGTPFTSTMNSIYDGIIDHWVNGPGQTNAASDINLISQLNGGNAYDIGRAVYRELVALIQLFRATGDIRLLDELARLSELGYGSMRTTWAPGNSISREPHGERFWAWTQGDPSTFSDWGGDRHLSDTPRSFRTFAQIAHVFDLNRSAVSGSGYNFGTLADKWQSVFQGYERVWSRKGDGYYPASCEVESTYTGYFRTGVGFVRAGNNEYPINKRANTHANMACAALSYYMARVLDKDAVGEEGYDEIIDMFTTKEVGYSTESFGEVALFGRGFWNLSPTEDYLIPITYNEYVVEDLVDFYLEGNRNSYIDADRMFSGLVRAYANWVTNDSTIEPDIGGGVTRSGTNEEGTFHTWQDACSAGGFCSDRTRAQLGTYGSALMMAWDTEGSYTDSVVSSWEDYYSGNGTWSQPEHIVVPVGMFLKEAGIDSIA